MRPWAQFKSLRGRSFQVFKDHDATQDSLGTRQVQESSRSQASPVRETRKSLRRTVNDAGSPFSTSTIRAESKLALPGSHPWDSGFFDTGPAPYPLLASRYDSHTCTSHDTQGSPSRADATMQPEIITPQRLLLQAGTVYGRDLGTPHFPPLWPTGPPVTHDWPTCPSPGALSFMDYFGVPSHGRLDHQMGDHAETYWPHHQAGPISLAPQACRRPVADAAADGYSSGNETIDLGLAAGDGSKSFQRVP